MIQKRFKSTLQFINEYFRSYAYIFVLWRIWNMHICFLCYLNISGHLVISWTYWKKNPERHNIYFFSLFFTSFIQMLVFYYKPHNSNPDRNKTALLVVWRSAMLQMFGLMMRKKVDLNHVNSIEVEIQWYFHNWSSSLNVICTKIVRFFCSFLSAVCHCHSQISSKIKQRSIYKICTYSYVLELGIIKDNYFVSSTLCVCQEIW